MSRHDGAEAVRDAIKNAEEVMLDSPSPTPELPHFPVMAKEAFCGLPGEIVHMIEPHTESDSVAVLLTLHAFFGNAIGRGPHYRVEGDEHGPNLFALLVGDTAKARKGTSAGRVRQFFKVADETWESRCIHTGLSSGEGVIWAVRDPIIKPVKKGKGIKAKMVEEEVDHGIEDKRLMIQESEFAGALRVMQRDGNILSRVLRDAWDRGNLASMTKNSPARATGACISIVAHITVEELKRYFDRTEMANGFGNRFLFACVRRSKLLPFGGDIAENAIIGMARNSIAPAIERARQIGAIVMADATRAAWEAAYSALSEARPGLRGALTARAEAQTVRLALVYALWAGSDRIEPEHLAAAMAVVEFCRASVEYIFGAALGNPTADTILAALRKAGSKGMTRNEIANQFSRHASSDQITGALEELSRRSLIAMEKNAATGGRPAEIWIAVGRGG